MPPPSLAQQTWRCLCDRDKDLASSPVGSSRTHLPQPQTMGRLKGTASHPQERGYSQDCNTTRKNVKAEPGAGVLDLQ